MKELKEIIPVPPGLSEKSSTLWREIVPKRASSPSRLIFLETALRELDRADEANRLISEKGLICITPKSGVGHTNPLVKIELQSRALFAKLWVQLGLRNDPVKPTKFEDYKFE
jgi:hypothetical protein